MWDEVRPGGNGSPPMHQAFARKALNLLVKVHKEGGAAWGTRTHDPIITNDVLYQLS